MYKKLPCKSNIKYTLKYLFKKYIKLKWIGEKKSRKSSIDSNGEKVFLYTYTISYVARGDSNLDNTIIATVFYTRLGIFTTFKFRFTNVAAFPFSINNDSQALCI